MIDKYYAFVMQIVRFINEDGNHHHHKFQEDCFLHRYVFQQNLAKKLRMIEANEEFLEFVELAIR